MSDDREHAERTTVTEAPVIVRSNAAGWWIAAIVAIVAVAGLVFLFGVQNQRADLQAARDQGAAAASVEAASVSAQRSATQASQAAQSAADSTARASQRAAEAAQAAANQTVQAAQAAGDAARDAAATEPAQQQ